MDPISILEWNINQRGGNGGGDIPPGVKDEINGFDIAVLTEFCGICEGRNKFIASLEELGYHCVASENPKGRGPRGPRNDILIAVKKSRLSIRQHSWVPCYDSIKELNTIPENLQVDIDCDGSILTVVGVRIKVLDKVPDNYKIRKQEFKWVLDQVRDIKHPILMAGDFNHGRRGSPNQDWSMSIMEGMLKGKGFTLYTPEGSSIYCIENYNGNEFPDDHFAAKGAEVLLKPYDRGFTSLDPLAYFLGQDFKEKWYPGAREEDLAKVDSPSPDHAILKGTLRFPEQKE